MSPTAFGVIASLVYLGASVLRLLQLRDILVSHRALLLLIAIGIVAHFFSVYGEMFTASGINLRIQVMGSLIALVVTTLIFLNGLRLPVDNLFLIILPLAIAAILTSHFGNNFYVARENLSTGILSHIILSILAYSILTVATCQAVLLIVQDRGLRHSSLPLVNSFPPLMTMELLLFQFLIVGMILLTLSIFTGFLFLEDISNQRLVHHTLITVVAWIIFAILVWGRFQFGWRGAKAAKWTLSGFALLLAGYFGSKLVIEVILQS